MIDQSHLRQSSLLTAIPNVANRPNRTADRMCIAGRRDLLVLLVSGVAISAWALYPSTVESGIYVPLPETAKPFAANDDSASIDRNAIELARASAVGLMDAKGLSSAPTMYGFATVQYSSPVVAVSPAPLKAKLRMLVIQLSSMSGDMDLSALVAKLRALLELPDSALVAVLGLPEMADLNAMLDAASLGKVDLPGITKEMGKIELRSAPETPYQVEVAVNGKPTVRVDKRYAQNDSVAAAASAPAGAPAAAAFGFVTIEAGVFVIASAVTPSVLRAAAPPPETFAPAAPAAMMAMVAPQTFAPETPAPMMAMVAPETFAPETFAPDTFAPAAMMATFAPETSAPETFAPETFAPETSAPETSAPETPKPTASNEVTVQGTPTSADVMNSGNKFEPGSTEANSGSDHTPSTGASTPSATPTPDGTGAVTGGDAPTGGGAGGGGDTSPGGGESDGSGSDAGSGSP